MANIFDQFDKQQAQKNVFDQFDPDVTTDMVKGFGYGANVGIDDMLNVIGSPIRVPINEAARLMGYEGELIPQIEAAQRFNVAGPAETEAGRYAQATGEVAGASAIPFGGALKAGTQLGSRAPQMLQQMARNPAKATAIEATSTGGAGTGVGYAREEDLGPVGEIALGLAGGFAAPNALNIGARTLGGIESGAKYANRQVQRAQDPEMAAYQDVADASEKAGLDLQAVRSRVAPPASPDLSARGFTEDDLADIVSRQLGGESADSVAASYAHLVNSKGQKFTAKTARKYLNEYRDANPTDRNMIDIAKEEVGTGGATPLTNQARADIAIADDPVATQRLISRQREQPGRVANIIEQSELGGRNMDDELERLATVGKAEESAAYTLARQNAKPVNLRPVIRKWRGKHPQEGGEISGTVNKAVDLFFRGGMVEGQRNSLRYTKAMDVIDDIPTYLRRRHELDQLITRSMQDGRPTPLTRELTQLRTDINNAARKNNPELLKADEKFSGNRTTENLAKRAEALGKKLTPLTKKTLRQFRSLTKTQQEIMRVAFENKMASEALGVRRGNAAADQFNSDAFDQIVAAMYPRSAGKEIHQRGQDLLRNLRREAITTETTRDLLSGSRTAPLQDDMAELMEGPRAAANLATGQFQQVLKDLSTKLARQIGQRAAQERIRIVTETDPAKMLPMLVRLAKEAKTSGERRAYAAAIRQFKAAGRRPATEIGTIVSAGEEE